MDFDTLHKDLGKKWRKQKTEMEKISNFWIKIKKIMKKELRCMTRCIPVKDNLYKD